MFFQPRSRAHDRARATSARHGRTIGGLVLLTLLTISSAFAQDVVIHDCAGDNGSSPSGCWPWYYSPDVILRTANDNGITDQPPIANQSAYVYITLTNTGDDPSCCGTLYLYYRDSGTGLSDWPANWVNFILNNVIRADEIDHLDVCDIPPHTSQRVMIKWPSVPANVYAGAHHCLLARWVSDCDPMQVAEVVSTQANVLNNNNIVHKNCLPTLPGAPRIPVSVFNNADHDVISQLVMDAVDNGGQNVFTTGGTIKVILGQDLFDRWNHTGTGITEIPDEFAVTVNDAHATIDGLSLPGRDADGNYIDFAVNVEIVNPQNMEDGTKYVWTLEQHDDGSADGDGVAFEIRNAEEGEKGGRKPVAAPGNDQGADLRLSVRPSVSHGNATISYVLAKDANVTLAIYDGAGRLVRTLLANVDRAPGAQEVEWDGKADGGAPVSSGTYFCRMVTSFGTAEQQVKIVR